MVDMQMKRNCLSLLLALQIVFIFVLSTSIVKVNALNTGFDTNSFLDKEKNMFISNINVLLIDKEPAKKTITCFDVNCSQLIAIGLQTSDSRKTICIYSNEGVFQYGYTFNCSGSFGVEWDEENLNIYFVRSNAIVSVSPNGEVIDAFEIHNTIENNSYINHFIHATKRTIGNNEYSIGNSMGILNWFATSYSQINIKDITGNERVIYDVSSAYFLSMIVVLVIVGVFVSVAVAAFVWQFIKLRNRK